MLPKAFEQYLKQDRYTMQQPAHICTASHIMSISDTSTSSDVSHAYIHTHRRSSESRRNSAQRSNVGPRFDGRPSGEEDEGADRYAAHHTRWHTNAHSRRMAIHQTTLAVVKCS